MIKVWFKVNNGFKNKNFYALRKLSERKLLESHSLRPQINSLNISPLKFVPFSSFNLCFRNISLWSVGGNDLKLEGYILKALVTFQVILAHILKRRVWWFVLYIFPREELHFSQIKNPDSLLHFVFICICYRTFPNFGKYNSRNLIFAMEIEKFDSLLL